MTPYQVKLTEKAIADLSKLDPSIGQRVLDKFKWLAANMDVANPEPLRHGLKGKWKLRVGDWRIIYEMDAKLRILTALYVDHRSRIYKT